ncbi:MAG: threonylcarbamoyl-AMP synthase [Zoogloeaceae bacterium]|jgi:L-threonylcarbamoyladenylate synthase|nr:threonylcarbamoyl-AMP synthase [Zoogloeaceae bacterium]
MPDFTPSGAFDDALLARASALLQAGELVAFPTETVYGLGADAANPAAVAKIFAAKGRPAQHPLIVHLAETAALARWAKAIPPVAWKLAEAFWPGPLTLVLKKQDRTPMIVTGGQDTVGLRIPAHPLALRFLRVFAARARQDGVAAPSANRFGRISPTTAAHVRAELGERVSLVLDGGACSVGIESTILDLSRFAARGAEILRPGALDALALAEVLGEPPRLRTEKSAASAPRVSGSLTSHYAPTTPLRLLEAAALPDFLAQQAAAGRRCAALSLQAQPNAQLCRTLPDDPVRYAQGLYASLRELDDAALDWIAVEAPPMGSTWNAIHDRLRRAAT